MKKSISIILILILLCSIFSSCKEEEESAELYYPVTEDFQSLDPQIANDNSSKLICYNCFEGLVRVDENGDIVPAGAVSWTVSEDSLTYTFKLKTDAKWYLTNTSKEEFSETDSKKSPLPEDFDSRVTAKDYVFGIKRAINPETGSQDSKFLAAIKNGQAIIDGTTAASELGVEALDDFTLRITLDYADPDILYYLTRLVAMPCNEQFFNACRGRYGLAMEYMLCNGAYIVYRWTQGTLIRLEKNSLYTGDNAAKNDRVWIYFVADSTTVPSKILNGNYDAGYISAHDKSSFRNKNGFTMTPRNDILWGYWFNCKSPDFAVTELRQAFAGTVDTNVLTPTSFIENQTSRLFTDVLSPAFDFEPTPLKYTDTQAQEKYKQAASKSEEISTTMTVTVLTTEDFAESVKKQIQIWQRVFGIDVKSIEKTPEEAQKMFADGTYQIAFLPINITAGNTAEFFRTFLTDSDYNITGFSNSSYDKTINSLTNFMTTQQENAIYETCEQTLISDGVTVPVFTEASYFITGKDFSGIYSFSKSEVYFRNAVRV